MAGEIAGAIRKVIQRGGLSLVQLNERIETMYLAGRISGEEREELTELMHEKADPKAELGGWQELYEALAVKYNELGERVKALETLHGGSAGGGDGAAVVSEWKAWDGVTGGYAKGDVVAHSGRYWVSEYEGEINVWEPGAPGVDERYWKEIAEEEALERMKE